MRRLAFLIAFVLPSCGKEEGKPTPKDEAAPKPAAALEKKEKPEISVPQGDLPKMDPEKAKFIAVPSTPKDPEIKKAGKPAAEAKK
jgi:hypothetical protein